MNKENDDADLRKLLKPVVFFGLLGKRSLSVGFLYKESDLVGIAFRITMNTGQRFSTKVATAYFFFWISVPTNVQDVLQRH